MQIDSLTEKSIIIFLYNSLSITVLILWHGLAYLSFLQYNNSK